MQSLRIMGLCSLLAFSAAHANEQGQAVMDTVAKQVQGVTMGIPAGVVRAAAHVFVTGPLTSKMYGANNSRIARRIAAIIASLGLHLTVNGVIETAREHFATKVENNMDTDEDNFGLTNDYARITDWSTYLVLMALYTVESEILPEELHHGHRRSALQTILRGFVETPERIDWDEIARAAAAARPVAQAGGAQGQMAAV